MSYRSPIDLFVRPTAIQVAEELDDKVYKAVVEYGVNVEKEELMKALRYDRDQYDKGYRDGKEAAGAAIIRCKDCCWCRDECYINGPDDCFCDHLMIHVWPDFYCKYGERRYNGTEEEEEQ